MASGRDWSDARQVWEHHLMHHTPRPCSVIVGLGSYELRVADASAGHCLRGLAPYIVWGWSEPGSQVG
ncbi:hypothetical protein ACPXCO_21645 [Streptomyces cyaneofuscatus]|uniref:hypothetical protein n=1 Tax=Streptomyces cyaneofuscatus TaxID=66883 RepID=UPI003442ED9C